MQDMLTKFQKNEYSIWLQWILVTTVGFLLSLYWVEIGERSDIRAAEGAIGGIAIGLAQWLVLKGRFSPTGCWIFASMLSWALLGGSPLGALGWVAPKVMSIPVRIFYGIIEGAITGVIIGVGQWWVLKNHVKQAWLWILASIVGWVMGLTFAWVVGAVLREFTGVFLGEVVGLTLGWFIVAAITGVALCYLAKNATLNTNKVEVRSQ
jgi:Flp pilus assembly pilin Flp